MPYQHSVNNFRSTLAIAHAVGSDQLVLATGAGTTLGALGTNEVYRLTVLANADTSTESVLAIVEATTLTGDTLSGLTFVEGYSDVALPQNSGVQVRATAKTFSQIHGALNGFQTSLTNLQGAVTPLQTGLSAAQGNITALQGQVSGLTTITETSISSATTLLAGGSYVCLGTSPYTVTLPTAVGVQGQTIHLRMSNSLTKLVTIATTSSQAIDGQSTRIMYAGETATLMSDGSNWVKVGGRSLPMVGSMRLVSTQNVTANVAATSITWNGTEIDNTGLMCDAASAKKITIRRTGNYRFSLFLYVPSATGGGFLAAQVSSGPGTASTRFIGYVAVTVPSSGGRLVLSYDRVVAVNAGDTLDIQVAGTTAWSILGDPTSNASYIDVTEVPSW